MNPELSTILVVDDQDAGRFAKVQQLRRRGFRVLQAATGQEALDVAAREPVDVVLLDINLPDLSGLAVCQAIKNSANSTIQVLQLSSTAVEDADRVAGLQSGADAYLTEPVGGDVLAATIDALLRVRRAETALQRALASEREARREAEDANRVKDVFLATLSHELRTPLNAMVGWTWQLRHGRMDPASRERALDGLERSTAQQTRLINDLMDVSRIAHGKLELEPEHIDLEPVLRGAVEAVQANLDAKRLAATVETVPALVHGDAARLQQVFVSLLTNACQFSQEGGAIHASLDVTDGWAVIAIRDTGRGIAADVLPHIFDQFRQGDSGATRRHGGLGLGLTIVRELVDMHHGTVQASSPGVGQGATFTVRLPLAAPDAGEASPEPAARRPLEHARVLVVDDDEDARRWLEAVLAEAGATAVSAASAPAALEAIALTSVQAIVSDIGMPGQDGIELLHAIRQLGHTVPAVAATAFTSPVDVERVLAAGYARHLPKPIRPGDLVRDLVELIEASGAKADGPGES